jgi:hypothetical protein
LKKAILIGLVLGLVTALALSWWFPVIEHERVRSLSTVQTNGGRLERFRLRTSGDALLVAPGAAANGVTVPAALEWPAALVGRADNVAVYHLRDADDRVIGVASRAGDTVATGDTEWVLFIPARGTLLLRGERRGAGEAGTIVGGSELFDRVRGSYSVERGADGVLTLSTVAYSRGDGDGQS